MQIQFHASRKNLNTLLNLKNYIIMDLEYMSPDGNNTNTKIVNISAKYFKDGAVKKSYTMWKAHQSSNEKSLTKLMTRLEMLPIGIDDVKSENGKEYEEMFQGFFNWLKSNSLLRTAINGWGTGTDVVKLDQHFENSDFNTEEIENMFLYDLQREFANRNGIAGMSLDSAMTLFGVKGSNEHLGENDVIEINEIKTVMSKFIEEYGV